MKIKSLMIMSLAFNPIVSHASVSGDLNGFFDGLGYGTNVSSPTSYKSQLASYYSGGSLTLKNRVTNLNLANIQLPSISAGCGGIDIFGGGLSFINSDQLTNFIQNVGQAAGPLAVDMAIQTLTPQLHGIITKFQNIADKVNQFNMNSCQTAQAGLTELSALATQGSDQFLCKLDKVSNGGSDWATATGACTSDGTIKSSLLSAKNDPEMKDLVLRNTNITWDNIRKDGLLDSDRELAEMFMTLSGTVIYDADGNKKIYPSLLENNPNLLDGLLRGGKKVKIYKCNNTTTCLLPTITDYTLPASSSFLTRVKGELQGLVTSYQNDTPLTVKQQSFIEMTRLPVLRMLGNILENGLDPSSYSMAYSEIIAKDALHYYLSDSLRKTKMLLTNTKTNPEDINIITGYINNAADYVDTFKSSSVDDLIKQEELIKTRFDTQKIILSSMSSRMEDNVRF